jgi:hypothetical protein
MLAQLFDLVKTHFKVNWKIFNTKKQQIITYNNDNMKIIINLVDRRPLYNSFHSVSTLYFAAQNKHDKINNVQYTAYNSLYPHGHLVIIHFNPGYYFDHFGFVYNLLDEHELNIRMNTLCEYIQRILAYKYKDYKATIIELFCDNPLIYDNTQSCQLFEQLLNQSVNVTELEEYEKYSQKRQKLNNHILSVLDEIDEPINSLEEMYFEDDDSDNIDEHEIINHVVEFGDDYWTGESMSLFNKIKEFVDDNEEQMEWIINEYGPDNVDVITKYTLNKQMFDNLKEPITQQIKQYKYNFTS